MCLLFLETVIRRITEERRKEKEFKKPRKRKKN